MPQTKDGYDVWTLGDWRSYTDNKVKDHFGDDADVSDDQTLGMISAVLASILYDLDQTGNGIRNGLLPQFAINKMLDDVCDSVGITRHPASNAYVNLQITGYYDADDPTTIQAGDQFSTVDNHIFTVINGDTINSAANTKDSNGNSVPLTDDDGNPLGIVTVEAYSEETGTESNVVANSIINPITSINGLYSVTNPNGATGGQDNETDEHLRARYFFQNTAYAPGSRNNIESEILNLPGVLDCKLINNWEPDKTDKYGNPPKSVHLYVVGGDSQQIAQKLQDQLYSTTLTMGNDVHAMTDDVNGQKTPTNFDRAQTNTVYINIDLDVNNEAFNVDTEPNIIKQSIIDYLSTFKMGTKLQNNRLYTLVFKDGVNNATIKSGTDKNNLSEGDIQPEDFYLLQVNSETVQVNVVNAS